MSQSHPLGIHDQARGLLNRQDSARRFQLQRLPPVRALADRIEHYWLVRWNLTGEPDHLQENLPHPSVHLVLDSQHGSAVRGVIRQRFQYRLAGEGVVFGVKFRPGAFSAFWPGSVHKLTDRGLALADFWDEDTRLWETQLGTETPEAVARLMSDKLTDLAGPLCEAAHTAGQLVAAIERDPELNSTSQLAAQSGLPVRALQRLFRRYIGVSPQWVIERYRMIEAVETLNRGEQVNLTVLAHRLGYFDQAHFSKAFKALVGRPPSVYRGR